MGDNKTGLGHRFRRGDDSVLNADSSAERRLLEGIVLVKLGAYTAEFLSGRELKLRPKFDLKATTGLPPEIAGKALEVVKATVGAAGGIGLTAVSPIAGGINLVKDLFIGPVQTSNRLNPSQPAPTGATGVAEVAISITGEVPLDDFIIALLGAGYLIEKANPAGIAAGLGQIVGTAAEKGIEAIPG